MTDGETNGRWQWVRRLTLVVVVGVVDVQVEASHHGDEQIIASHTGCLMLPDDLGA